MENGSRPKWSLTVLGHSMQDFFEKLLKLLVCWLLDHLVLIYAFRSSKFSRCTVHQWVSGEYDYQFHGPDKFLWGRRNGGDLYDIAIRIKPINPEPGEGIPSTGEPRFGMMRIQPISDTL